MTALSSRANTLMEKQMSKKTGKDIVRLILANPGCVAVIDNDEWWIQDESEEVIISSGEIKRNSKNSRGHLYGRDILDALAAEVGLKVSDV